MHSAFKHGKLELMSLASREYILFSSQQAANRLTLYHLMGKLYQVALILEDI